MDHLKPGKALKILMPCAFVGLVLAQAPGSEAFFFLLGFSGIALLESAFSNSKREVTFGSFFFLATAIALGGSVRTVGILLALIWPMIVRIVQSDTNNWDTPAHRQDWSVRVFATAPVVVLCLLVKDEGIDVRLGGLIYLLFIGLELWPLKKISDEGSSKRLDSLVLQGVVATVFLLVFKGLPPWSKWLILVLAALGPQDRRGASFTLLLWMWLTLNEPVWAALGGFLMLALWSGGMAWVGAQVLVFTALLLVGNVSESPELLAVSAAALALGSRSARVVEWKSQSKKSEIAALALLILGVVALVYLNTQLLERFTVFKVENAVLAAAYILGLVTFNLIGRKWPKAQAPVLGFNAIQRLSGALSYKNIGPLSQAEETFSQGRAWSQGEVALADSEIVLAVWCLLAGLSVFGVYWLCG